MVWEKSINVDTTQQAMLHLSLFLSTSSLHQSLSLCLILYDSKEAVADQAMFLWCLCGATRGRCCTDTIQRDSIQLLSSVSPFMQGKTPSAPVVPGALTADQKNPPQQLLPNKSQTMGAEKGYTQVWKREKEGGREGWKRIAPMKGESETNLLQIMRRNALFNGCSRNS